MSKTYGKDCKIEIPLIMWECVGGGWGIKHDDGMRSGDVHKYVEWMNRPSSWDNPQGIPLSGTVGLLPILDRGGLTPTSAYYLACIASARGEDDLARQLLTSALAEPSFFPKRRDAENLLKRLTGGSAEESAPEKTPEE